MDIRYVYFFGNAIYCPVRQNYRLYLLIIIGITEHEGKELVVVKDAYRELEANLAEFLDGASCALMA
ncbi:MAG: hypothetical protein ACTS73_00890 [Arsenophonus sp. NEOnobi-MAG3]